MPALRTGRIFCLYCKRSIGNTNNIRICDECKLWWDEWYKSNPDLNIRIKLQPLIEENFFLIHETLKNNPPNIILKNKEYDEYIGLYDNKTGDYYVLPEQLKVIKENLYINETVYILNVENPNFHEFFSKSYYIVTDMYRKYMEKEIGIYIFNISDFQLKT
ncbi:MAG: hypothetical protein ACW967_07680 [Candidatus Hodarchaeales archaeon]